MKISFHIERLVLDGFDFSPLQRRQLQDSLTAELKELMLAKGLSAEFQRGIAMPGLKVSAIEGTSPEESTQFGSRIAHSLYSCMGGNVMEPWPRAVSTKGK